MMKKYVSILLVFSFIFILVGCVGSKGEVIDFSDTFGKKTKLVIWLDDDDNNYMEALAAAFTGKNPNIVVEFMHQSTVDARERLKTYGQSDNGADIFQFPHDHMAQAILEDLVYPLPSTLKATALKNRFFRLRLILLPWPLILKPKNLAREHHNCMRCQFPLNRLVYIIISTYSTIFMAKAIGNSQLPWNN